MRTASRYSHASPDIMRYHSLCGENALTGELYNASLKDGVWDRFAKPSKVLSSSVERGEKGHERRWRAVKGVRIMLRQRDPRIQKACLLQRYFSRRGVSAQFSLFRNMFMLTRLRDDLGS